MSIGLLVYAAFAGVQGAHAKQGLYLTAAVGLCFIGIWLRFALDRKRWIDSYTWIPKYNLMVQFNAYTGGAVADVIELTERTIKAWEPYCPTARQIIMADLTWVTFEKGLNTDIVNITGRRVKGFWIPGTRDICVDFDGNEPLQNTAYEHELGHVIRGNTLRRWETSDHHEFIAKHGLK